MLKVVELRGIALESSTLEVYVLLKNQVWKCPGRGIKISFGGGWRVHSRIN